MRFIIACILLGVCTKVHSQELFVYSEPASNMAAKSMGFRLNNTLMKETGTNHYNYHLIPEVMAGLSKHIMIHGEAFFSNRNNSLVAEGGALYLKYRFYSRDEVHSHFRMAATAKASFNNSDIHQEAIDLNGHNSGVESGLIATKLINKVALSTGATYIYAADNSNGNKFVYGNENRHAIGYNFSVGKLILPREYTSYKQTNLNLMMEFLGQTNLKTGKSFLDIAPSVQLIFHSRVRVDIGYRYALVKDLQRSSPCGGLVRFEYNIFNAF